MTAHEIFWQHGQPVEPGIALDHDLEVDFLIIGGGYTGLSAARFLKEAEPSMSIAVVEREHVGYGASGRNTGFLTPLVGHDLSTVLRRFGLEKARSILGFGREAVAHAAHRLETRRVEMSGVLVVYTSRHGRLRASPTASRRCSGAMAPRSSWLMPAIDPIPPASMPT